MQQMEHDSSRSGYHEPEPGQAGLLGGEYWQDSEGDIERPPSVNLIWAQAWSTDGRPGAIGNRNGMPWHLSEDLRHFKELTISHPVVMGRRTWESMGSKPLPNRDNIVVTTDPLYRAPGATVVTGAEDALDMAQQEAIPADGMDRGEIWIIGGAKLFESFFPLADRAFVTDLDLEVPADTFMPDMDDLVRKRFWRVSEQGEWEVPASTEQSSRIARYCFTTYEKVR